MAGVLAYEVTSPCHSVIAAIVPRGCVELMIMIYRITYPIGTIYIGQDRIVCLNHFGCANRAKIAEVINAVQRRSFTIVRDSLWESESVTRREL